MDAGTIVTETDFTSKIRFIQYIAQLNRIRVFDTLHRAGSGHWGGSASSAEILAALYYHIMNFRPDQPNWPDRDRFILSKGHAAPMLYTVLADNGFFPLDELATLRQLGSRLQGHPCMIKTPGVDLSTGALGHGISVGLGMALAAKLQKKKFWTFVLVGEGCLNEGQSWEAVMSAAKFSPSRLAILVDYNKVQLDGTCSEIMPLDPLVDKFRAFRININDKIYNGHNVNEILSAWDWMKENQENPMAVIFNTHKGKGVSFMEDNFVWHGNPIDDESYGKGRAELKARLDILKEEYERE